MGMPRYFCLYVERIEKHGFAKQNANLSVNGWQVRVRAGATVAPGDPLRLHHERSVFCLPKGTSFNDIRSLRSRMIYASHMIYPLGRDIRLRRIKGTDIISCLRKQIYHTERQHGISCGEAVYH